MTKCKECGAAISTKADACPKCGAKQIRTGGCAKVALGFVLFIAFVIVVSQCSSGTKNSSSKTSLSSQAQNPQTPAPKPLQEPLPKPGDQWNYYSNQDDMGKGVAHFASVESTNTVDFDFPYAGPQHATLTLRSHPRYGKDVILSIERGQFLCNSYQGCAVLVRFDDDKALRYSATGPSDNSTTTIFIHDYSRFVKAMSKAKRMRISAEFFQQGAPILDFDASGFDESKFRSSSD